MARNGRQFSQSDLDGVNLFSYGDVSIGDDNSCRVLRAPLFSGMDSAYIVEVKLVIGQRLVLEWTEDQSNMYNQFDAADANTFVNGEYILDSSHFFVLHIENGKPYRPDFRYTDSQNRAFCCVDARAFILFDPTLSKTSTYVQVSENLIIELSHNRNGCVHMWRRKVP